MDLNPEKTIHQVRTKFIKTCVASCVICYVLGIGDRHLENILVTTRGELLHIDFSYILGEDPKESAVEMKITDDMLDMLGGKNSLYFRDFMDRCKNCYKKVRQHSNLWYLLFLFLVTCKPSIREYDNKLIFIKDHVIEKLIPFFSKKYGLDGAISQCFNCESDILLFLKGSSTLNGFG